jgi:chemotaxis signal transduction protein
MPLVDLRVFMGMPRSSKPKYAAVLGQGGSQIAVLIDDVPEIRVLDLHESQGAVPDESMDNRPFFSRRVQIDGRSGGVVDPAKLLAVLEHANDQHVHGFMIDGSGIDSNERAVIQEEHRTTADGEENDHGEA